MTLIIQKLEKFKKEEIDIVVHLAGIADPVIKVREKINHGYKSKIF